MRTGNGVCIDHGARAQERERRRQRREARKREAVERVQRYPPRTVAECRVLNRLFWNAAELRKVCRRIDEGER